MGQQPRACITARDGTARGLGLRLQEIASLCAYGFLQLARQCYERARELAPQDLGVMVNLANLARAAGSHAEARQMSTALLNHLRNHAVVRCIDPAVSAQVIIEEIT